MLDTPTPPEVVRLVIPGNPKGVQRTKSARIKTKDGREFTTHYTPAQTRNELAAFRFAAMEAMQGRPPFTGPVELKILMYLPVPASWSNKKRQLALAGGILPVTKPDFDNCSKFVDGLKHVVWLDDTQVADFHGWRRYSDRPRVIMEIRQLIPSAAAAR